MPLTPEQVEAERVKWRAWYKTRLGDPDEKNTKGLETRDAYVSWNTWLAAKSTAMQSRDEVLDEAAAYFDKKAELYMQENASHEPDTGAVVYHYGDAGMDYYHTLIEMADEIRSLKSPPQGRKGA